MSKRARVIRPDEAATVAPLLAPGVTVARRRIVAREEVLARLHAERVLEEARAQATHILAEARERALTEGANALAAARAEADTQLTARWLALRAKETGQAGPERDRIVGLAVLLAERLVGRALELDPALVASMAETVLREARGARRATVEAHPEDAALLRRHLAAAGLDPASVDVREDAALARGSLRLHTDVGTLDAQLAPRLERLAAALRDALA